MRAIASSKNNLLSMPAKVGKCLMAISSNQCAAIVVVAFEAQKTPLLTGLGLVQIIRG